MAGKELLIGLPTRTTSSPSGLNAFAVMAKPVDVSSVVINS